jgi:uncharacterized protein (TIRG00374 family)
VNPQTLVRRLLGAALLGVVVYGVFVFYRGYWAIGAQLAVFRWEYFGAALALTFGNYVLRFLKWEFYLARLEIRGIPKLDSFLTFLSGFVLTVTPGKVGEVFKSLVLAETHGVPGPRTAPIVVAERLTDLIGIIGLVIVGSLGFQGGLLWAGLGAAAVVVALGMIASRSVPDAIVRWMEARHGALMRLAPRVKAAWESLRLLTSPGALLLPTVLSLISWAMEGLSLWVLLQGFGVTSASLPMAMFFYATSQLAGALIPVPGGLGVTEGSLEQQLTRLGGVPMATATSAMILVRIATLWFAVALGFLSLALLRLRFPRLLSGERSPDPPPVLCLVAMKATYKHTFNTDIDTYWNQIFFNPEYNEKLFREVLKFNYELLELTGEPGGPRRRRVRIEPKTEAPAVIKKLIGDSIGYLEEGSFDPAAKKWSYKITTSKMTDKISISGLFWAEPRGEKKIERICEVDLNVKVFGVGGTIEEFIAKTTGDSYEKAWQFTNQYIASKGL